MKDVQHRTVKCFMVLQKKAPNGIHEELMTTIGTTFPNSIAKKWAALFKAGRQSTEDDPRGELKTCLREYCLPRRAINGSNRVTKAAFEHNLRIFI